MSEVKKEVKKPQKSSTKVKVKNISKRAINLANGRLEADKVGTATLAELQVHGKIIEKV